MFGGIDKAYYTKERTPAQQWAFERMKRCKGYTSPTGDVYEAINTLGVGRRGFNCRINGERCHYEDFEERLAQHYPDTPIRLQADQIICSEDIYKGVNVGETTFTRRIASFYRGWLDVRYIIDGDEVSYREFEDRLVACLEAGDSVRPCKILS